ncbi:MAG: hypothetical protein AAB605_02170 [Patescibacteria group bacterium]
MIKQLLASSVQLLGKCKDAFCIRAESCKLKAASSERGFTILLAALVASLVLTLGISVFSIAQKQVVLSSLGRSSQFAFYTADTAAECALYWDIRHDMFSTTPPSVTPSCDGAPLALVGEPGAYPYTISFEYEPNGYCAQVSVTKDSVDPRTVIHADGFSTNCADISVSGRSLQRSVELIL